MQEVEITLAFQEALDLLDQTKETIFITGEAGSGKSTLLTYFLQKTSKSVVVLAPTGVAALNVGGETIHSFFRFKPGVTVEQAGKPKKKGKESSFYQKIDRIVIDEISMVRADLLDCVDVFLQKALHNKKPFGGIPMAFFGDLYQLPPVVVGEEKKYFEEMYESPYFFSSNVMKTLSYKMIELDKIYRQTDPVFISLLNALRKNCLTETQLASLNLRVQETPSDEGFLYLTATNALAEEVNQRKLEQLPGEFSVFRGDMDGDFEEKVAPTDVALRLKIGAQVMFLVNHPEGLWVNGTVGKVLQIFEDEILVELEEHENVMVKRYTWEMYKYAFDAEKKKMHQEEIGSFTQYPIKLAWGITIHKSQGKTFDKVIIDVQRAFAHGQTYVALSRCRSLEGLFLKHSLKKGHMFTDYKVVQFLTKLQYATSEKKCSKEEKIEKIQRAIAEKKKLSLVYLKPNDEKSRREVLPLAVGEMEYSGKTYIGMEAFCLKREEKRIFRVDRILEVVEVS